MKARQIGISMRVVGAAGYFEPRDCLAHDWMTFMAASLPEVRWLPIPNLGDDVVSFLRDWHLDGFILSGGNDIGECLQRDRTEEAILRFALENGLPLFGVCRGLQLMQVFFGGSLSPCSHAEHVGVRHLVRITGEAGTFAQENSAWRVNSFHNSSVPIDQLAPPLRAFAVSEDGLAEGVLHPTAAIMAVQWHPERPQVDADLDRRLFRRLFLEER